MKAQLKTDSTDLQTFEIDENIYYVKSYEGWDGYFVSTCGHVISTKGPRLMVLKQHNDRGYAKVRLSRPGTKILNVKVHRMVAQTFLETPSRDRVGTYRDQVNHLDGDKWNNKVANLEWCSRPENLSHYRLLKAVMDFKRGESANDGKS